MKSETPRTDKMNTLLLGRPLHEAYKEMTKFSGDMERQRDAYKKALEMAEDELMTVRAEIESLKLSTGELNGAFNARPKCEKCKDKEKLIEQMREALRLALPEARSTHCERTILAALAAERGE